MFWVLHNSHMILFASLLCVLSILDISFWRVKLQLTNFGFDELSAPVLLLILEQVAEVWFAEVFCMNHTCRACTVKRAAPPTQLAINRENIIFIDLITLYQTVDAEASRSRIGSENTSTSPRVFGDKLSLPDQVVTIVQVHLVRVGGPPESLVFQTQ